MSDPRAQPTGTVTLLLGDVESSTELWVDEAAVAVQVFERFGALVAEVIERHSGTRPAEQGEGDSFVAVFVRPVDALRCAVALQMAIAAEAWPHGGNLRVRMALHSGDVVVLSDERYAGVTFSRCARLRSLAHGGQVVVSQATTDLLADELPPEVLLVDLGMYELRGLSQPERVFQVVHGGLLAAFPPLRAGELLRANLPAETAGLIGRAADLAELVAGVDTARIVTLVGSGGVGKTRLALELGRSLLQRFNDGVWWVELGAVSDPALVADSVVAAIGCRERPGESSTSTLVRHLRHQRALLILDNCEHLLESSAHLVDALVRECAELHVLATSREVLAITGEIAMPLSPLQAPPERTPEQELMGYAAVELFVDRAVRARPSFELSADNGPAVAAICRRLDGIPLAIELAAVRVRLLAPAQIADALRDRFGLLTGGARTALPRQRTLEASVDWSYSLLDDQERVVLTRAAVFAGSFDLDAAEAVCATDDAYAVLDVLDVLAGLVDKSLVEVDAGRSPARYRLLETIRAFAMLKLADRGDVDDTRTRHLVHFTRVAERLQPRLRGDQFDAAVEVLDSELDNLRAALEWAVSSKQPERHLRLASSLWTYWFVRSMFAETQRTLAAALEESGSNPRTRSRALSLASIVTLMGGRYRHAAELAREAVAIARDVGDRRAQQLGLTYLGWSRFYIGEGGLEEIEAASELAAEASEGARLTTLYSRGVIESNLRRPAAGRPYFDECLAIAERDGDRFWIGTVGFFAGQALMQEGRLADAEAMLKRALEACRAVRHLSFAVFCLGHLSACAVWRGDYDRSLALLDEATQLAPDGGPSATAVEATWRSFHLFASGDLVASRSQVEAALAAWNDQGNMWEATYLQTLRSAIALRAGEADVAHALADDAVAAARQTGMRWQLGQGLLWRSRTTLARGGADAAEADAHDALQVMHEFDDRLGIVGALETLAAIAAETESFQEAGRLVGAAERLRDEHGYVRLRIDEQWFEELMTTCPSVGLRAFDDGYAEGTQLGLEEAIAYTRRGRGERRRPSSGWASLSPTELDVVKAVAAGLSNPEIATKLFISRNTVKTHLAHVFAKVGVTSRAELAAAAARREP